LLHAPSPGLATLSELLAGLKQANPRPDPSMSPIFAAIDEMDAAGVKVATQPNDWHAVREGDMPPTDSVPIGSLFHLHLLPGAPRPERKVVDWQLYRTDRSLYRKILIRPSGFRSGDKPLYLCRTADSDAIYAGRIRDPEAVYSDDPDFVIKWLASKLAPCVVEVPGLQGPAVS
jgi:hypothetical protein